MSSSGGAKNRFPPRLKNEQDPDAENLAQEDEPTDLFRRHQPLQAIPSDGLPDLGPLGPLLNDPTVTEIMVNGAKQILIERNSRIHQTPRHFESEKHLNQTIKKILQFAKSSLSEETPYVDLTLPDGTRVNIIVPPLTRDGACLTFRKFIVRPDLNDLVQSKTLSSPLALFLQTCVKAKLNILISGGTSSGKTTILNALANEISKEERIVLVENAPELSLDHPNVAALKTRQKIKGFAAITERELIINALRMRPDRLIVGEVRGPEAIDMLQAMNTGHDGSLTTIHANGARDSLSRLETLCMMSGTDIPLHAIRRQISNAIDLVVQVKRLRSGRRVMTHIVEISGMESENITTQDLVHFEIEPKSIAAPPGTDRFIWTGVAPRCFDLIHHRGVAVPHELVALIRGTPDK